MTRSLGSQGIPVYVASDRLLAASAWSRHAAQTVRCPPIAESERFLEWLTDFGRRHPGTVLYPTSDETAFLYALHADELRPYFRMYQPELDAILHVLDKRRLYATATSVGLDVPETWFPDDEEAVAGLARELPMPLLVKPRTQVLSNSHTKGVIVRAKSDLAPRYREFIEKTRYARVLSDRMPDAANPMIQRYLPDASTRIHVMASFMDRTAAHFSARSGTKILQRPRRLGIGLCFEDAPVDPRVADGVRRLARAAGHFGVFQLEFVREGDRYLLIDYNPRFYNQLAFDVARGLPIPQLVYAAALGDDAEVERLVANAERPRDRAPLVFCNTFGMTTMLGAQRCAGVVSAAEVRDWSRWRRAHNGTAIEAAFAPGDALPGFVDAAFQLYEYARHPRAFVRKVVLDLAVH